MNSLKVFAAILLFALSSAAFSQPLSPVEISYLFPSGSSMSSTGYLHMNYSLLASSSEGQPLQLKCNHLNSQTRTLRLRSDGTYAGACGRYKLRVNISKNLEDIEVRMGETIEKGFRVYPSEECQSQNGKSFCPGQFFTSEDGGHSFGRVLRRFLLKRSGAIAALETDMGFSSSMVLQTSEPVSREIRCSKNICVGDVVLGKGRMDLCKVSVEGFSKHGILVKGADQDRSMLCLRLGELAVYDAVSDQFGKDAFEVVSPEVCDDLSRNEKQTLFDEAAERNIRQTLQTGKYDQVSVYRFCDRTWGCGWPVWAEVTNDKTCRIFGYTRGFVHSPLVD